MKLIFFVLPMQNGKYPPVTKALDFAETRSRKQPFHIHGLMENKGQYVSYEVDIEHCKKSACFLRNETKV